MYLGRPSVPQHLHNVSYRGAANYRIVNHDDPFAAYHLFHGVELGLDSNVAHVLVRLNECASDVSVSYQSFGVRNVCFRRETCGVRCR